MVWPPAAVDPDPLSVTAAPATGDDGDARIEATGMPLPTGTVFAEADAMRPALSLMVRLTVNEPALVYVCVIVGDEVCT